MPPVFGPVVAVEDRACSPAAGAIGTARSPSHEREQRELLAVEVAPRRRRVAASPKRRSTRNSAQRGAARPPRPARSRRPCRRRARRPSARPGSARSPPSPPATVVDRRPRRGRHAGRLHDLLRERLGALEPRRGARRAERRDAGARRARRRAPATSGASGPTTTRSTASLARQRDEAGDVVDRDRATAARRPRSPGCRARTAAPAPAASARARARSRARARREPTTRTFTAAVTDWR